MLEAHILSRFDPDRQFQQLLKTGVRAFVRSIDRSIEGCIKIDARWPTDPPSLHSQTRVDGRALTGLRRLTLFRGMLQKTTAGSALVKIGGTKVVAGVTLLVGKPGEETPGKGEIGA